jgi:NAD-dependent dihydropyrimidine dehydrogenase PreA subunit
MAFFIGEPCTDIKDRSCVEECPVDCIYEGDRKLYINPAECIECGACEPVCPVEAIATDRSATPDIAYHKQDNARFFYDKLPERDEPLGNPGGADKTGPIGVDTPSVSALPRDARTATGKTTEQETK